MAPKFSTGQRLICFGKEVEVLEVIEDVYGSLNEYRLKDIQSGEERLEYENTLTPVPSKIVSKPLLSPEPALPPPKNVKLPQNRNVAVLREPVVGREITKDTPIEEANYNYVSKNDVLNELNRRLVKDPNFQYEVRRKLYTTGSLMSALKQGTLEDLLKLLDD